MAFNIQNITPYERSSQFSERRRSLFPQNNSGDSGEDSDLGCMSPLSNSSLEDSDELLNRSSNNIDDYDVIGIVRRELNITPEVTAYKNEECVVTTPNSKVKDQSLTSFLLKGVVSDTPIQKTPHDTLSVNSKLPKLSHKSVTDSDSSVPSKRKLFPYNSPEIPNKSSKVDIKNSKVRTTLFPEIDLFLSTKKFYSNCDSALQHHKIEFNNSQMDQIPKNKMLSPCASVHSRKKQYFKRNSVGSINAGVKHKIRKPKPKRNTVLPLAKSKMNESQGKALRNYLENLRELKQTNDNHKMIVNNKENTAPVVASTSSSSMELSVTHCNASSSSNYKNAEIAVKMTFSSDNPTENMINVCESLPKEQEQFLNFNSRSTNQPCSNNQFSHNQKNKNFQVPINPFASNFSFTSQTCSKPPVDSELSKKRPLSPANDEPDQNKKFFKFSRSHKGVVNMNESIKLMVDHGKVSLLDHGKVPLHDHGSMLNMPTPEKFVLQQPLANFEQEDFTVEEPIMSQVIMDNILSSLDDETVDDSNKNQATPVLPESQQSNQLIVQPSTSSLNLAEASQAPGSIVASSAAVENLILSPISQMCDVTSGLALNSPKRAKNLTSLMETLTRSSSKKELLSPIGSQLSKKKPLSLAARKFRKLHKDQMLLDAGQKKFGVTQCLECNFVYHLGDPSDEACHMNYHDAIPTLKFTVSISFFIINPFFVIVQLIKSIIY